MTAFTRDPEVIQTWEIIAEQGLVKWSEEFISQLEFPLTLLLDGPMGSGKTTLVRQLVNAMGGEEASSPTFSLVNEYRTDLCVVHHFDLYRLENPHDLEEIGFEEYLDAPGLCIVEWPQLGADFYDPERSSTLRIEILSPTGRRIEWYKGIAI